MTKKKLEKASDYEGKILPAVSAVKKAQITSAHKAACLYNVSLTTLLQRLRGHPNRARTRANDTRLSYTEEESLKDWIVLFASQGAPPRPFTV
jgi:hypothetical protein